MSIWLSYLGYGLLEAWSACMFFTQGSFLPTTAAQLGILSSVAVTFATLLLVLFFRRHARAPWGRAGIVVGSAVNSAATLLVLLGPEPMTLVGGAVSGLANAWLWVGWGDVYARLDTEAAERTAIASATVQAVVVALVLWLPSAARVVVLALLAPVAGALCLRAWSRLASQVCPDASERVPYVPGGLDGRFLARLVAGLGLPIAVLYFLLDHTIPLPEFQSGLDTALVAGLLLFMVVLYGFTRFAHGFSVESLFGVTASLIVVAIVLHALGTSSGIAGTLVFTTMLLCQYLLLLYAARLTRQGLGDTMFLFSAVQLVNHGSGLVGTLASLALLHGAAPGTHLLLDEAMPVVLVAILFGSSLFVRTAGGDGFAAGASGVPSSAASLDLQAVAASHGLSPRETEVFELLVKGRSAPFIRDELCISLNTVTSHIKHIYAKLGVHSRQELIDLVQS